MSDTPTREEVARAIVRAATPDDLEIARKMRENYLAQNPGDEDIQAMVELLTQMETVIQSEKSDDAVTDEKP